MTPLNTPKPTKAQAAWLGRIARSPLMKTHIGSDPKPRYSLQDGTTVPINIATTLICNGLVYGRGDGLFGDDQSWTCVPPDVAPRRNDDGPVAKDRCWRKLEDITSGLQAGSLGAREALYWACRAFEVPVGEEQKAVAAFFEALLANPAETDEEEELEAAQ